MNERGGFEIVESEVVADVGFIGIERRVVATPSGRRVDRYVVAHPGAVAIVPRRGDDVILIEQYRVAVDSLVLELPAGKLDPTDDDPRSAAHRELREETGFTAGELVHLTDLVSAVGFSNEVISIYLATDVIPGESHPEGEEETAARIVTMEWDEAIRRIETGAITDAKTIAGILLADRRGPT